MHERMVEGVRQGAAEAHSGPRLEVQDYEVGGKTGARNGLTIHYSASAVPGYEDVMAWCPVCLLNKGYRR
jgi:hypothetical protein